MKKLSLVLLLVLLFSISIYCTAISKEKKTSTKQKKKTEAVDASPLIPFDIDAEKLPPHYKGTDIVRLYSLFAKKTPLKKEEFETTVEYEKKIAEAVSSDIYAFRIEEGSGLPVHGLRVGPYDADTQSFRISLETEWLSKFTFMDYRASIIVKTLKMRSRSYLGSNAFGAMREVTRFSAIQYGLALVNQEDFGSSSYDDNKYNIKTPLTSIRNVNITIQSPPDKARTLKDNIGVLLLCKPVLYKPNIEEVHKNKGNDLIFESFDSSQATIDDPTSHLYERKYINVEILAIWIYNIRTGEVILKKQLKDEDDTET
ncbi:MAG: hypothetical protein WCQ90_01335 [Deltaproteobacteria bacterium]